MFLQVERTTDARQKVKMMRLAMVSPSHKVATFIARSIADDGYILRVSDTPLTEADVLSVAFIMRNNLHITQLW